MTPEYADTYQVDMMRAALYAREAEHAIDIDRDAARALILAKRARTILRLVYTGDEIEDARQIRESMIDRIDRTLKLVTEAP